MNRPNFQYLAQEYQKLLNKKYIFKLANGECLTFEFTKNDFYHLLGFRKFEDTTVVKMIKAKVYNKDEFYEDVLAGDVTFDATNISIENALDQLLETKIICFCDNQMTKDVERVLTYRFPYFSYENIMLLLNAKTIAVYDKEIAPSWSKIEADKLFFKLLIKQNRNLNLFIRNGDNLKVQYPVSFFLEDRFRLHIEKRENGTVIEQDKLSILYRIVKNSLNGQMISFDVYWNMLRTEIIKESPEFSRMQKVLGPYFKKENISQKSCIELLSATEKRLQRLFQELEINRTDTKRAKAIQKDIKNAKRKIQYINQYIEIVKQLDKNEIIHIYEQFEPQIITYEDDFFAYLVLEKGIKEKAIFPCKIKSIYGEYKKIS